MKNLVFGNLMMTAATLAIFFSCSSKPTPVPSPSPAPANLTLGVVVAADSSGSVTIKAAADNAVSFEFDLGNGIFQTSNTGMITYQYAASGDYTIKVVAKNINGLTLSTSVVQRVSLKGSRSTLALVWSDEFDVPGAPNPAFWGYDLGNNNGWGNHELEYYTNRPANAYISNGTLKIVATKENYNSSQYTSARLLTQNKFSFVYGKIEIRAKLPAGLGTWPAIWMLGDNFKAAGWPTCGEMDIMEAKGKEPDNIYGTLHFLNNPHPYGEGSSTIIKGTTTGFHRYGLTWSPSSIELLVDDVSFFKFPNSSSLPFNQKFFVILNLAMGGDFTGPVDPSFTSAQMEVDYVRVYQ